jgi:hypothetical protein
MALRNYLYAKHLEPLITSKGQPESANSERKIYKRPKPESCGKCADCDKNRKQEDIENLHAQLNRLHVDTEVDFTEKL